MDYLEKSKRVKIFSVADFRRAPLEVRLQQLSNPIAKCGRLVKNIPTFCRMLECW